MHVQWHQGKPKRQAYLYYIARLYLTRKLQINRLICLRVFHKAVKMPDLWVNDSTEYEDDDDLHSDHSAQLNLLPASVDVDLYSLRRSPK